MTQVFKKIFPLETFYAFLQHSCRATDRHYIYDMNAFKKILFYDAQKCAFIEQLLPHYHASKRFYVTRKLTYNSMANLIRQICNSNNVPFEKKLVYDHSTYTTVYSIRKQKEERQEED